jgi:hypothetical protein
MSDFQCELGVPEDPSRLAIIKSGLEIDAAVITKHLRFDQVVLIQEIRAEQADNIIRDVADELGLSDSLKLQAAFAGIQNHRHNIGKYFMSVNSRTDYQFISPHSEGNSTSNMQLASFFCYENNTDGGETILMNVDESNNIWDSFREQVRRLRLGSSPLTQREIQRVKGMYKLSIPESLLKDDDEILHESKIASPDLTLLEVLAKPRKSYSRILNRELYVYWDSIGSIDFDSGTEYFNLLKACSLLREPDGGLELSAVDNAARRRVWRSGVKYAQLFKCKLTRRLAPGDLILQNNMTWAHSANNWSPNSGVRKIAASFA